MASCRPKNQTIEMVSSEMVYKTEHLGFSQAVRIGNQIITSGQVGYDCKFKIPGKGDFKAQAEQSIKNIEELLLASNTTMQNVVLLRFYVKDLSENKRKRINQLLYKYYPGKYKPATSLLGVNSLAIEVLEIEIEAIAIID